jgi:hypothetical protein
VVFWVVKREGEGEVHCGACMYMGEEVVVDSLSRNGR